MSGQAEPQERLVPKLFTTAEACELLSMSKWTLQGFVDRGQIIPIRDGRWVRYSQLEIDRFVVNMQRRAVHLEPLSMAEYLTREGAAS